MHHPWRALGRLSGWSLHWRALPEVMLGFTDHATQTITLDPRQSQAERRCTLAHELEHVRRGPMPIDPRAAAREESAVEQATARALIGLERLGDALAWSLDEHEVAEVLWVDVDTLLTRLQHLHPSERAFLMRRLEHHHESAAWPRVVVSG